LAPKKFWACATAGDAVTAANHLAYAKFVRVGLIFQSLKKDRFHSS